MDEEIIQTAGAVLYPKKIVIETRNLTGQMSFYSTDDLTILPVDCSFEVLGRAISAHLSRSVFVKSDSVNYREVRKKYLKKGKFKSEPDFRRGARYVAIFRVKSFLRFEPRNNVLSDGRWGSLLGMPEEVFRIDDLNDYVAIGSAISAAWAKCIFS
ncbi:MAG TPA: hypothetical protein VHE34_18855 [Puia sp.]|uniref:hypothetical protein n=1 Tax=Puia sp. TaxID=2045100 RepID=UPI002C826EB4|nr:hypothetical protein [Puia sp.]HVU97301.1 hypothetical protein [Puia sp.]